MGGEEGESIMSAKNMAVLREKGWKIGAVAAAAACLFAARPITAQAAGGLDLYTDYPGMTAKAGDSLSFSLELDNTGEEKLQHTQLAKAVIRGRLAMPPFLCSLCRTAGKDTFPEAEGRSAESMCLRVRREPRPLFSWKSQQMRRKAATRWCWRQMREEGYPIL